MSSGADALSELWTRHDAAWRRTADAATQWAGADGVDPRLLRTRASGTFWELLERLDLTILVTREYEHLALGLGVTHGRPRTTFMPLPHPSGIAVELDKRRVHVASTRNPNQVFTLEPVTHTLDRGDMGPARVEDRPLVPVGSRFYPGSLYIHDLAVVANELHANAVAHNAVVRLPDDGGFEPVWWPKAIERAGKPDFSRNYLQLNSIAAGRDLTSSFYSASAASVSSRRPGHRNFAVDGRGVIFSGVTREPVASGLTRPHSARIADDGRLWVDNSGYGEVGVVEDGAFAPVALLPGWTRGLAFHDDVAFVASSRVIPGFENYAPGLDVRRSVCGLHALDIRRAEVIGSLVWPYGNQVFAVECVPRAFTGGFPFDTVTKREPSRTKQLFYGFSNRVSQGRDR
jgi:uncharacterized protein (TIGR03032 family)